MDIKEIKNQKEDLLQEIRNLISSYSQIIEKNEEEIKETEYEELKRLADKYKELEIKISTLEDEKSQRKDIIQKVKEGKIIAPLVPIEDIVEGMTEEKLAELENDYNELQVIFESEEYIMFSGQEIQENIKNLILKYEEKVKKEKEEKIKEEIKEKKIKEVKDLILSPGTAKGVFATVVDPSWNDRDNVWTKSLEKPTSEKVAILFAKYGIKPAFFEEKSSYGENDGPTRTYPTTRYSRLDFTPYEKCDLSKKQACKEFEKRMGQLQNSENEEHDKPGIISLDLSCWANSEECRLFLKENIQMEITQRELLNSGILPEDLGWTDKTKITSKDIAEVDKEQGLTTTETSGIKGFFNRLLNKFKGKGEK